MKRMVRRSEVSRVKLHIAVFISVMLCSMLLFSGYYLAKEWGHDCDGGDCPICECMTMCQEFLGHIYGGGAEQTVYAALLTGGIICLLSVCSERTAATLITWKVRLNP